MRGWDAHQRIIYLIPLENVSSRFKTLLLRCPIVFGLPRKGLVLIYTFVNPVTTSFRPPGPRLSHKNVCSFISRVPVREHLISSICWGRSFVQRSLTEPCYYSLPRSRSFRNCHVALLLFLHVCYRVNGIFCLFWLFFLMWFFLFPSVHYHSNMHACMFFFFF